MIFKKGMEKERLIEFLISNTIYPYYSKTEKIFFRGLKNLLDNKKLTEILKLKTKQDCDNLREIIKKEVLKRKIKKTIKDWPETERPRERLAKCGAKTLSDAQLLAIILRTGSQNISAVDLATILIDNFGDLRALDSTDIADLCLIKGIDIAKATQIKAALEIGKRFMRQKIKFKKRIKSVEDVVDYYRPYLRDLKKEVFKIMLLDGRNKFIDDIDISEGSLTASLVDPKDIIKEATKKSAATIIFVHNHPSGESEPSEDDIEITNRLIKACNLVGLKVLDHIIIGQNRRDYTSFLDKGLIKEG